MIVIGKYKIKFRWKEVCDNDLSTCYYISPYWGSLYSGKLSNTSDANVMGLKKDCQVENMPQPENNKISPILLFGFWVKFKILIIHGIAKHVLARLPLIASIKLGFLLSCFFSEKEDLSKIQAALFEVLGKNTNGTCLVDSLTRFFSLMNHGASLAFGVFVPTNLMHAWVEIDNASIDEDLNFLGHYQKSLEFYVVNDAKF